MGIGVVNMSYIFSLKMYFSSFIPLWVTVLFVDIKSIIENTDNVCTEMISVVLICLGCLVCVITPLEKHKTFNVEKYELSAVKECKTVNSEFLLSYILPLFAFDFTKWDGVVQFLIFFIVLGYLCIRHNYFSVNIILELKGFKMYECTLINSDGIKIEKMVISKQQLSVKKGDDVELKTINNDIFIDETVSDNKN